MRKLNQKSTAIFNKLTEGLNEPGDHKKIDNTNGSFMPVVIEHIGTMEWQGKYIDSFSIAHYFKQNGDLMQDPEMTFYSINGYVFPAYFLQAGGCFPSGRLEQESIGRNPESGKWWVKNKTQADHTSFANVWMKNIKQQQGI